MTVDARLFDFPLDVQRERLAWRRDAGMQALARELRESEAARAALRATEARIAGVSSALVAGHATALDPERLSQAVRFLAGLHREQAARLQALEAAETEVAACRAALAATQREAEQLDAHRDDCLADFVREQGRLESRRQDQDWTSRDHWRQAIDATNVATDAASAASREGA